LFETGRRRRIIKSVFEPPQKLSPEQLFEKVCDSVVVIKLDEAVGSGFFVGNGSIVATNHHVVGYNRKVKVKLHRGGEFTGHVLRSYPHEDLAFVHLREKRGRVQPLRSSSTLKVGQTVLAVGSPLGMEYSLTRGIISAVNREALGRHFVQTDASISPGNSGGPLYDEFGSVVGVNTSVAGTLVGLAIPSELAAERLREVMDDWTAVLGSIYCVICGHRTPHPKYCEHCGVDRTSYEQAEAEDEATRVERETAARRVQPQSASSTCVACGTTGGPGVKYCPKCGSALG
jgi:S1-C subfamily serine protease